MAAGKEDPEKRFKMPRDGPQDPSPARGQAVFTHAKRTPSLCTWHTERKNGRVGLGWAGVHCGSSEGVVWSCMEPVNTD